MKELTPSQREPLFQLAEFQLEPNNKEDVFAAILMEGWNYHILPWNTYYEHRTHQKILATAITHIPKETLELWIDNNYIAPSTRTTGGATLATDILTFVLRQETFDYKSWTNKPRIIRAIIILWKNLVNDVPSLIWGVIGAVITVIILKLLEL